MDIEVQTGALHDQGRASATADSGESGESDEDDADADDDDEGGDLPKRFRMAAAGNPFSFSDGDEPITLGREQAVAQSLASYVLYLDCDPLLIHKRVLEAYPSCSLPVAFFEGLDDHLVEFVLRKARVC